MSSHYEYRTNPDNWRHYSHEELVQLVVQEVVFADANLQHERQLRRFEAEQSRTWAARVWTENRRGARVMAFVRQAEKAGRKTVRVEDLLEVAQR